MPRQIDVRVSIPAEESFRGPQSILEIAILHLVAQIHQTYHGCYLCASMLIQQRMRILKHIKKQ